jgi:hypothetical protein
MTSRKMKYTFIFILSFLTTNFVCGQEKKDFWYVDTENDYFWKPNSPIMDGYTLWLLRQKLNLNGYQTILESEYNLNQSSFQKICFNNYLPLLSNESFSSMVGTRYNKYDIRFDNKELTKEIQHVWLWTAWQYRHNRWNFTLTTENYFTGDETSLYEKTGNKFFSILYVGYELNKYWNLILLGGYDIQQMENEAHYKPIIALQARYQPSTNFKCLFGVPTIFACEWTFLPKTDLGIKYFITGESIAFIQQRFGEKIHGSIQYKQDYNKSDNTYFNGITYQFSENENAIFNNATYLENQLSAKLSILIQNDLSLNIGFGYNFNSKIELFNNDKILDENINSFENFVLMVSIQYLKVK